MISNKIDDNFNWEKKEYDYKEDHITNDEVDDDTTTQTLIQGLLQNKKKKKKLNFMSTQDLSEL